MSLRIMLAFEDHTQDQYVVRPVVEALLKSAGWSQARVRAITDPRIRGIEDLANNACAIMDRYGPLANAVVFAIDADRKDGAGGRGSRKADLEKILLACDSGNKNFVVVAAIQEIEVWALWGSKAELRDSWATVRGEQHPKEVYFDGLATDADLRVPGKGRSRMVAKSLNNGWASLKQGCKELAILESELLAVVQSD